METINQTNQQNPINDSKYINQLNNIEAQIHISNETKPICNESCYAKCCLSLTFSLLLSPFAICDVYFATTDNSCVNQSQSSHNLNITLHSYLLASGIIVFTFIGILNFSIFICDLNMTKSNKNNENVDTVYAVLNISNIIVRIFGISWLILGCVLFWAYTVISDCSKPIHDYLFARFILFLIFSIFTFRSSSE